MNIGTAPKRRDHIKAAIGVAGIAALLCAAGVAPAGQIAPGAGQPVAETFGRHASQTDPTPKPAYAPPSVRFGLEQAMAPVVRLGGVDRAALLAEDALMAEAGDRRLRVSTPQFVTVLLKDGVWRDVPGGRLWMVDVTSEGAYSIRAQFTGMNLPEGAELITYSTTDLRTEIDGPTPPLGRDDSGAYWTGLHAGDTMRVEYFVPEGAQGGNAEVPFAINEVQHGYREIFRDDAGRGAGNCHNDPACFPAWEDVSDAVARIFYVSGGEGFVCSGQLINTISGDETPYFLTANHCLNSQAEAATVDAQFQFRRLTCGGPVNGGISVDGADHIDSNFSSDHTLLMLVGELPSSAFFAGWTTSVPPSGTDCTAVHHPAGDYGRISFGDKLNNPSCGGAPSRYVGVSWNSGVSEPGSSGSGFFRDSTQQLFGVLTCGFSSCSNPNGIDSYGRFDYAYFTAGFSQHLDEGPDDGFEPNDVCGDASPLPEGLTDNLIVKSTAEDWYTITLPAGGSTTISALFFDSDGDIDLALYDGCGGALLDSATSGSSNEFIAYANNTGAQQTVYLHVYLDSDTRQTYSLNYSIDAPPCEGDFDGSGAITSVDLFQLLGVWGSCPGCAEDLDDDDTVGSNDLFILLGAWGDC